MSFKTRRLPALIERGDLGGILSLRGEKLTYLRDGYVYVVRSGSDPRAWRKAVDGKGSGIGPWEHCRPQCDYFFRSSSVFGETRSKWIEEWQRTRERELIRRKGVKFDTTAPIWKRGRRAIPELRSLQAWAETARDEEMDDILLPRRFRTIEILRRDSEEAGDVDDDDDYYSEFSRLAPMVTTEYLLDQHYLLRRILKLEWVSQWAASFPPDAIQFLEEHQFSTRRWHLLNLWIRVPEGQEVFNDLPQLAWLLASSWNIKRKPVQRPFRSLRSLVRKPRSQLLAWLDLPGGRGTFKLLRRIHPADMSPTIAYWLREALRNDRARSWLQNMDQRIDGKMLYLLGREQPITFPVARAIARKEKAGPRGASLRVSLLYFHVRKMLREFGREEEIHRLSRIHSPDRLREWHDQLIEELNIRPSHLQLSLVKAWEEVGNMVSPPLEPTESIRPLTTHEAIAKEGIEMHHCIATYSSDVVRGIYYGYAILLEGERATLGLQCGSDKTWRLAELRGKRNARVSTAMRKHVADWIRHAPAFTATPDAATNRDLYELETEWIDESEYADAVGFACPSEMVPF